MRYIKGMSLDRKNVTKLFNRYDARERMKSRLPDLGKRFDTRLHRFNLESRDYRSRPNYTTTIQHVNRIARLKNCLLYYL